MAIRIPWDKYEVAILISACLEYNENKISKNDAIKNVSMNLRQRAVNKGIFIDDVFRNENGISMQFEIMNGLIKGTKCGLHNASKLFIEMSELYKDDKLKYMEILKEAKEMNTVNVKEMQDLFSQWLSKQLSPAQMSEIYMTYYDMDEYLMREQILHEHLLETYNLEKITKIRDMFDKDGRIRYIHRANIEKYSKAINLYLSWLTDNVKSNKDLENGKNKAESIPLNLENIQNNEILYVDFNNRQNLAFTSVKYFEYFETRDDNIGSWKQLYQKVLMYLYEDYPSIIMKLKGQCIGIGTRVDIDTEDHIDKMIAPRKIANDLYVETNLNATNIIDKIRHLLDYCMVDYENLIIAYVSKKSINNSLNDGGNSIVDNTEQKKTEEQIVQKRKDFSQWLNDNGEQQGIILVTLMDMSKMNKILLANKITNKDIYMTDNISALKLILGRLQRTDAFLMLDKRLQKQYINTFDTYIRYKTSKINTIVNTSNTDNSQQQDWSLWEFLKKNNLTYIDNCNKNGCLWVVGGKEISRLMMECWKHGVSFRYKEKGGKATDGQPAWWAKLDDSYRESNANTEVFEQRDSYEMSDEENKLLMILSNNFENGYRVNSAIDRGRFRNFYSLRYDSELDMSDEQLVCKLKRIGTIRDERIFVKQTGEQTNLMNEIFDSIMQVFNTGASCVYLNALYQRYSVQLSETLQIYDSEVLGEQLMKLSKGKICWRQSYLYLLNKPADLDRDIVSLFQMSPIPLTYDDLREKLWYIPLDKIKHVLVVNKEIVQVAPETYFYAQNLPINNEELQEIKKMLHQAFVNRSYITDVEMRNLIKKYCPGVAINTDTLTTYGLRNCLGYILKDSFSFNGPIISERGREISTADVYSEYCKEREQITLDELKKISSELNTSIIYWDAVREQTIRLSDDVFIRKDQVIFDVDQTDRVLDMLCDKEYIPFKDICLFMQFPPINIQWNGYVLESYLYNFSRKYKLIHVSFSASGYFGAIVKKDSKIADYQTMITDVLANSNKWNDKLTALELFVDLGYQQRKNYANIEKVIHEAKILRENRKLTK